MKRLKSFRRIVSLAITGLLVFALGISSVASAATESGALMVPISSPNGQLEDIVVLAASGYGTYALTSNGGIKGWGSLGGGVEGLGAIDVHGLTSGVTAIAAPATHGNHACILTESGGVKCWGANYSGQIGNGTTDDADSPADVMGLNRNVAAIAAGLDHNCAVMNDGAVKCWGQNEEGQLGDGTTKVRLAPVDVQGLGNVVQVAASRNHTCALTNNGGVKCWGNNYYGQLGDGTTEQRLTPVDVKEISNAVQIAAGDDFTCALTEGGGVKCWGAWVSGALGVGETYVSANTPQDVVGLDSGVVAISAGYNHACALTDGGGIKCWGSNQWGQVGSGNTEPQHTPVDVVGLTSGVTAISTGYAHTCAVVEGNVKCWGMNKYGQLGDGTTTDSWTPVDVVPGARQAILTYDVPPHIRVYPESNFVAGLFWPVGAKVTLTIDDPSNGPGTDYSDTQVAGISERDPDLPYFRFDLDDAWSIQAGQIVSVTDDTVTKSLTVPNLAVTAVDPDSDTVSGTASPNVEVQVSLEERPGEFDEARRVLADTSGNWVADFSIPGDEDWEQKTYDVRPGEPVMVEVCVEYYNCTSYTRRDQASQPPSGKAPFREAGSLAPEITTYIPTPLDVSTEPAVVGTNLLLAALMMLAFAVAAEFFTRIISEHEETLRRRFRPAVWIGNLQDRLATLAGTHLGRRPALLDVAKLLGVMFFYGLVFSLLDPTWHPLSLKGVILFFSMTIAFGLVGIADDILQWRAIRRWSLPADLTVRPTSVLLAGISTATTRLLALLPGLMFGTPEALHADESLFDARQRNSLLRISALTFAAVGLGVWLPTILTAVLQRQSLPETLSHLLGGLEGFLLVIFAVTLENLFVQMLGLPGSLGQALKRRSRRLWLIVLIGVTFLFYHTLINPRGDLAQALQESNVLLFLSVAGAFVAISFALWLYTKWQAGRSAAQEA